MSQELLRAWVHNVLQNPTDEHQLAHAEATKELMDKLAKAREALEKIVESQPPTDLANDLGVNSNNMLVYALKIIAMGALRETK